MKKIIKIFAIVLGLILVGLSAYIFYNNNYKVVINIYSGNYNDEYTEVVSSKKLVTYTYDVTVNNNHVVINNIK